MELPQCEKAWKHAGNCRAKASLAVLDLIGLGAGAEEDPKQLGSKPKNIYFEIGFLSYFGQLLEYIESHAFEYGRAGTEISSLKHRWQALGTRIN